MDDLISRQEAIELVESNYRQYGEEYGASDVLCDLSDMPSAQTEIIRCKDCKHFAGEGMYCANDIIVHFDHFYCYYADMRGEEE